MSRRYLGITLVEVVVVMGLIMLLMGLLLPAALMLVKAVKSLGH
jgi:type II secretory pathway pseudopilin PulG